MNKHLPLINSILLLITVVTLNYRISQSYTDISSKIENTIVRLIPQPDTSRVIVAPELETNGKYYYFTGKVIGKSTRFIDHFDFSIKWPREIWEGYITVVRATNGGNYWMWSQEKITQNIEISLWCMVDPTSKLQIRYSNGRKDVYAQMLFPITPVTKPAIIR